MQNISKHELTMDGESLTARFVRGDDSRSTSGSGLGLDCEELHRGCGTCAVSVQGDLFRRSSRCRSSPPEPAAPLCGNPGGCAGSRARCGRKLLPVQTLKRTPDLLVPRVFRRPMPMQQWNRPPAPFCLQRRGLWAAGQDRRPA